MLYRTYAEAMKERYGEKVYKLPVSFAQTCPNRDGTLGTGGCIFCGASGTGYENLPAELRVREQLQQNMEYIGKRYGASRFIAYFQNFTNTWLPLNRFLEGMREAAAMPQIAALCISTRPDCISDRYLQGLREIAAAYQKDVVIELGLQSVNPHTLRKLNRGHTLPEFIDAVLRIHRFGFEVCAHLILNLPWDDAVDAEEAAGILAALGVEQVKLHSLYIETGTELAGQYMAGAVSLCSVDEYVDRVIRFLERIPPDMVVQRLVSRAPAENTVFCNWGMSWWKIRDRIEETMKRRGVRQGARWNDFSRDYEMPFPVV